MSASNQLYQEVILDHTRTPRNWGAVADANLRAEGHNPLCGDHIVLTLSVGEGRTLDAVGFEGEGCAICKASASMMTMAVMLIIIISIVQAIIGEEQDADLDKATEDGISN